MYKTQLSSIFFRSTLANLLLFASLYLGWNHPTKTLADSTSCDSRNPYNLVADTTKIKRITISWNVCQKNDFYQVSWGDDKNDLAQIDDPTSRSWTYVGARDSVKYKFKIRGCNAAPTKDSAPTPDCTPWSELVVTTPDW